MELKFALTDFAGNPVSYWKATEVTPPKPVLEKSLGHHIVIVDRSGSMYGAMKDTKAMVEKVMVVEEFQSAELLLTLVSYSSAGDFTVHFSRTPVAEVLDPSKPHVESIRSIQATCLTCASQALEAVVPFIGAETTAISLHTDGWFNDASPASEQKKIDKVIKGLEKMPNVMVNTIAYGSYSDFNLLSTIANRMSGKCILAKDVKQVYSALHDTTALLAGRTLPALALGLDGADWQIALNLSQRKVNGAATDLTVRGVGPDDEIKVYRFSRVGKEKFDESKALPAAATSEGLRMLVAFARTKLAEGKINEAKYAVNTACLRDLTANFYNALSSDRLTAFALALDAALVLSNGDLMGLPMNEPGPSELATRPPLTDLFALLNGNTSKFSVDLGAMLLYYQRRGVVRLNGKYNDEGVFVANDVDLVEDVALTDDPMVEVTSFAVNLAEATVNMGTKRDGVLVKGGKRVTRVAGKKLDLSVIRSYTIIGDGAVLMPTLEIEPNDKAFFTALQSAGFVAADAAFGRVTLHLSGFPIVPLRPTDLAPPTASELTAYARNLMRLKVLEASIPSEAKGTQEWTPEQVEELRAHGLTPGLSFSAPTTNPYRDQTVAASEGLIDSYTRYGLSYGTELATDLRKALWSANEYLARRFSVKLDGAGETDKDGYLKKPKFEHLRAGGAVATKTLSARTKLSPLDALVMPVFVQFVGSEGYKDSVEGLKVQAKALSEDIAAFEKRLSALALAVGSTGLIPDEWSAVITTGEALATRFPEMDIPKAHKDATFFEVDGVFIGVHPEVAWYSTPKGVEAACALEQGAA